MAASEVASPSEGGGAVAQLALLSRHPRVRQGATMFVAGKAAFEAGKALHKRWKDYLDGQNFVVSIRGDDGIYDDLHEWILDNIPATENKSMELVTDAYRLGQDVVSPSSERSQSGQVSRKYAGGSASQAIGVSGHRVVVEVEVDKQDISAKERAQFSEFLKGYEKIKFTCPTIEARDAVQALVQELVDKQTARKFVPVLKLATSWGSWNERRDIPDRPLDTIIYDGTVKEDLVADLRHFFDSEALYNSVGQPWHRGYLLHGPPGMGKAQPLDARVLTPTGWTTMGQLRPYDQVVGSHGAPTTVTGVFDQGEMPVFKITLSDGASVEATGNHLWHVHSHDDRQDGRPGRVLTTDQINEGLDHKTRAYYLPMVEPVRFQTEVDLPVDPYLLGLLLGDGSFRGGSLKFTSMDRELLDAACALAPEGTRCTERQSRSRAVDITFTNSHGGRGVSSLMAAIRSLGLDGHLSTEKFIPEVYLRATQHDRLALLQGLMDTDGGSETSAVFATSSQELLVGVQDLVHLLGGTAYVSSKIPTYGDGQRGKRAYRLAIRLPVDLCPFRLQRKSVHWGERAHNPPVRSIVSVEAVRQAECRCIAVEAYDNLYVTNDGILTHNTSMARALASHFKMNVYYMPLSDMKGDTDLIDLVAAVSSRSMLLLEDVDVASAAKNRDDEHSGVTLSGLLNSLDGVATPHGLVTMMTTNDKSVLDKAALRDGRVDRTFFLGNVTLAQLQAYSLRFLGRLVPDLEEVRSDLSAAELANILVSNDADPETCVELFGKAAQPR